MINNNFQFPNSICGLCKPGTVMISNQYNQYNICVNQTLLPQCNIANCQYCVISNICSQCLSGWTLQNISGVISCQPNCNVLNCAICWNNQNN